MPFTFGAWNVRTLLDHTGTDRQERTALVAHEPASYNVQIAALSETRLAEEGQLTEQSAGYKFVWIGGGQATQGGCWLRHQVQPGQQTGSSPQRDQRLPNDRPPPAP